MPKRVITAAVGVAGLVVIGLGVASATAWRADDVLVATTDPSGHLIVTDPGVLEMGGDPVTVSATAAGGDTVVLAIGRDTDVAGWVGSDAHTQVTGLSGWHELEVTSVPAGAPSATPSPSKAAASSASAKPSASPSKAAAASDDAQADPTGSDLWVAQATGKGSARLVWPAQPGRWSLLVAGTEDSAPALSLAWPRVVTTPWLWPLVILGSILVLIAAALLGRDWYRRRTGTDEPVWHPVTTGAMPTVAEGGPALTRRQIREAELARSARPRTGAVPRVPTPPAGTPGTTPATPAPAAAPAPAPTPATTTRRALRTGAIPTVAPAAPATQGAEPATEAIPRLRGESAERPPAGDGGATAHTGSAGAGGQPGSGVAEPASPRPAWLRGRASEQVGAPSTTGGATGPAASGAPHDGGSRPGDLPTADAATTAVVPTVRAGASGWVPTPPPGATPGTPASTAPHSVTRPAWLPTHPGAAPTSGGPGPDGPGAPERDQHDPSTAEQPGSRADAWRRAWGLPSTDEPSDEPSAGQGEAPDRRTEQGEDR
ncbi:hypothetical protein [Cellulomonas edaphi]|uniref:Uncharacterized protein n=1 Tax=Cellulomonas edaphi TaxID=3053468 RepID=A0ABT7S5Y4_9CELL|nr:hypothetical protein [Cellulomons edaphi]MDM7830919.1 hypothetical protein [Cellulomons edaphi]